MCFSLIWKGEENEHVCGLQEPRGRILLLAKFIFRPEHLWKELKINCMAGISVWEEEVNMRISSAKRANRRSCCPKGNGIRLNTGCV